MPPPPLPFLGLPAPESHTGGLSQGGYSRGGGWKAVFCHRALEFPHQDSSGDRPPSTLLLLLLLWQREPASPCEPVCSGVGLGAPQEEADPQDQLGGLLVDRTVNAT